MAICSHRGGLGPRSNDAAVAPARSLKKEPHHSPATQVQLSQVEFSSHAHKIFEFTDSSGARMTFWQENYSFIKEVYDTRYAKMVEWMDNVEMAIQKVCASRVYTSAEVKREKDNFHVRRHASFQNYTESDKISLRLKSN